MKAVVTGGAGFIGSNLAIELQKKGYETTVVDNLHTGNKQNLKGFEGMFLNMDTSDKNILKLEADVVFHQAAITDPRFDDDDYLYKKNLEGFLNALELAKKNNARLVYASTANLYGNGLVPMKENQKKEIISAYGRSKLECDRIAEENIDRINIVGLRYFNVFGPREEYKGKSASMIYHLWKQISNNQRPRLFKHGEQKRDHIYVKDVVRANLLAAEAKSGIYNIGTGIATSFKELVDILNGILEKKLEIKFIENPYDLKTYQSNTLADTTKATKYLRFKHEYDLVKGIKDYLPYLEKTGAKT